MDEDKNINIKIKYTQEGAEKAASDAVNVDKSIQSIGRGADQGRAGSSGFARQLSGYREQMDMFGKDIEAFNDKYMNAGGSGSVGGAGTAGPSKGPVAISPKYFDELGSDFNAFTSNYNNGTATMEQRTKVFKKEMNELYGEMRGLRYAAMGIGQIGSLLTIGGGAITAAIALEANNYVKTVGVINDKSAQWLGYQNDIKQANLEIGQSATQALLPGMQLAASLMQKIAAIVKENPWIIQAALVAGSTMLVLGTTATLISKLMTVVADLGLAVSKLATTKIGEALGMGVGRAATAGGAEVAGGAVAGGVSIGVMVSTVAAVLGGVLAGGAIVDLIHKKAIEEGNADTSLDTAKKTLVMWGQLMPAALEGLGIMSTSTRAKIFELQKNILGLGDSADKASNKGSGPAPMVNESQMVEAWIAYQKQMKTAQDDYSQQRVEAIKQYEQQIAEVTAEYESQRADIIASYNEQMARSAEDFARSQRNALDNYNNSVTKVGTDLNASLAKDQESFRDSQSKSQRAYIRSSEQAAQQHALDMLRLEQQHNIKLGGVVASRDALGIVKENQNYALEKANKEQDFQIKRAQSMREYNIQRQDAQQAFNQQRADRIADANRRLAEMKVDFERQRAQAQEAESIKNLRAAKEEQARLAKLDADHKIEMDKLDKQEKDKLSKMDDAYRKQASLMETAFADRLRSLNAFIFGDTAAFNKAMQEQLVSMQTWISNFKSQITSKSNPVSSGSVVSFGTGKQYGGYAQFSGHGETGRPEYVMDGDSTQIAESIIGSRLNKANMLSALMSGRGGGSSGNRTISIVITGKSLTISEIRNQIDSSLNMKLSELVPAFGV